MSGSTDVFAAMSDIGASRLLLLADPASGLRAMIALDDVTLGPACGGIRTRRYPSLEAAISDAHKLASAMTLKCAIAGLPAGGGKTVMIDHDALDRPAAFRRLGRFIDDLGGVYRAAGDLGTTQLDLSHAAEVTEFVNTDRTRLGDVTGDGIVNCVRALADDRGVAMAGLRVAVQGCGLIGAGVARRLAAEGAVVMVGDMDSKAAEAVAGEIGGSVVDPDEIFAAPVDIVAPCAVGGTVTPASVAAMRGWGICGGANNQLADAEAKAVLTARGIAYVPDFIASSGAVIDGISRSLGTTEASVLIARLYDTTHAVLRDARDFARAIIARGRTTVAEPR